MMKHLAAMNIVLEVGLETYTLLDFSRTLTEPVGRNAVIVK